MLTVLVLLPTAVAVSLLCLPRGTPRSVHVAWTATAVVELALTATIWLRHPAGGGLSHQERARWLPSVGAGYHVGVDGLSLPLVAMSCVLFLACALYTWRQTDRVREFAVLFLFLQSTSLGLFVALDLILFFLFFDLSLVAMYFVIAGWGHRDAARSALLFFLYTFTGSLALLLGFIGLYLAADPHTFDIVELTRDDPLAGRTTHGALVLLAVGVGLAIKTPTVPFHTWLPPAHTDAPAAGSAVLAGVLLKMGTYGFLRIAMPVMPGAWRGAAVVFVVVGVVSVVYGALVAFAQTDFKRMVAYTSVNHMGYIVLAVGAAGTLGGDGPAGDRARHLAVTGSVFQMVSHGLLTGALFLLCGVLYERGGTHRTAAYSGVAHRAPVFAALTGVAAFASLGLPGFSGFIAEFQILTGSLGPQPVATGLALLGVLLTAALLLRAVRQVFTGPLRLPPTGPGQATTTRSFPDLAWHETASLTPLLALAVVLGLLPRFVLDVIEPASLGVLRLLAR
ncbi:complex I subunit 4 family protein [Wenjunlia vitaminophila]|uniref:complex I subunit 4 family protein n=1 Tax=Wenjunlia vitaminophila TaxID=76728 RepID=UPI00036481F9|nr:NADH-quinone oxidoreductase subunit M [Wenjunlia vitaminophila]